MNGFVIIPTLTPVAAMALATQCLSLSARPKTIMVINNSKDIVELGSEDIIVYNPGENIGVNASWNKGLEYVKEHENISYISFLNDDITIEKNFFMSLEFVLEAYKNCGVVCPRTEGYKITMPVTRSGVLCMHSREGWAFTMRADLARFMPLIPETLRIFCGDDWLFAHSMRMGKPWYVDLKNVIRHQIGMSMKKAPQERARLSGEKSRLRVELGKWGMGVPRKDLRYSEITLQSIAARE